MYSYSERRQMAEVEAVASKKSSKGSGVLVALAVLVLVLIVSRTVPSDAGRAVALPTELNGTWIAEGEIYEGRFFQVTSSQVVLGLGAGQTSTHPLRAIRERPSMVTRVFELEYATTEGIQSMEVHLHPDETIRLRNPSEVVWRRR